MAPVVCGHYLWLRNLFAPSEHTTAVLPSVSALPTFPVVLGRKSGAGLRWLSERQTQGSRPAVPSASGELNSGSHPPLFTQPRNKEQEPQPRMAAGWGGGGGGRGRAG